MRKLDPQRFECAVKALALCRAKYAVRAQILANGEKVSQFSCRELNDKRQQYFEANMEELISKALVDVWRLPQFARYRQTQTQPQRGLNNLIRRRAGAEQDRENPCASPNHDNGESSRRQRPCHGWAKSSPGE